MRTARSVRPAHPVPVRLLAPALVLCAATARAQEAYRLPPEEVVRLVDAAPAPSVDLSPDGRWMLLAERAALPSIADLARPMHRLAGLRIDPAANARYRTSFDHALSVRASDGGPDAEPLVRIAVGDDERIAGAWWSHDSDHFAYLLVDDGGTTLCTASVSGGPGSRRVFGGMNTILQGPRWLADGTTLLALEVPEDRGEEPAPPRAPRGPNVQSTEGSTSPLRTYQDLLASPHDEALFEHHVRTQVVLLSATTGERRRVGEPGLYRRAEVSPDGRQLLVERIQRPFSYLMPYYLFPTSIEVWDPAGRGVRTVFELPLGEDIPLGGVPTGPRDVDWRPDAGASLVWVEALDGGDPDREAAQRDRWMELEAPFDPALARELVRVEHRARGLVFLADGAHLATNEYDRDRRWWRVLLYRLDDLSLPPRVLEDRSVRDAYGNPGSLLTDVDAEGRRAPIQDGLWLYRAGEGASPEGLRPFLDRQNVETLEVQRLWRCGSDSYERVAQLARPDDDGRRALVTVHETTSSPPNYRRWDLAAGISVALTAFPDPTPELRGIRKELVTYERADGVPLSATLYVPEGWDGAERLPLFLWAYPLEYNDPDTAGQVTSSPHRFTRVSGSSHLALVTQGYAVMDGATMPVIGDPETMNDTFVEQIVAAAEAAIDKAVELGVADRDRVAVGGHSYGAFMTANLLAHCELFRAGVARSGAYNRSLTPFGFQSERRTFWEDPAAYFRVSPFMHADHVQAPLLLIHGEIDNNSGTFPLQSRRMFQAIKGHGGTARLVMLPHESHGYRARESVLHVQAETIEWLDRHVKAVVGG